MAKKIKKSTSQKSSKTPKISFRERKLKDIPIFNLEHPKPIPGYKATLPGAPGWWAKESPGA